jgi:hypothetical protein
MPEDRNGERAVVGAQDAADAADDQRIALILRAVIMRVGQNPASFIDTVAQPKAVTVALVTYIPFLEDITLKAWMC